MVGEKEGRPLGELYFGGEVKQREEQQMGV